MPHLTIEYSANLESEADMPRLCLCLHAALMETGLFELGAVRVRAVCCPHYAVADLVPQNAFAAMLLRIGAGRSAEDLARLGQGLMAAAEQHFKALLAQPHFALSLDIVENKAALSWKTNAIHPRLRGVRA